MSREYLNRLEGGGQNPTLSMSREDLERDLEAIALRIRQISALAGVLAEGQEDPLSHALHLIEESLLEAEARLERLYQPRPGLLKRPRTSTRRSKPSPKA